MPPNPIIETPRCKQPFTRDPVTGKVQVVEQDSIEHVMTQELTVTLCPTGARPEKPEFGWPWPSMRNMPIDATPLLDALERWVPGPARTVDSYEDAAQQALWHIDETSRVSDD